MRELIDSVHARDAAIRFRVGGQSMHPSLREGDIITLSPLGDMLPRRGEVVAFQFPDREALVIHRVLRVTPDGWLIKGDNNTAPDGVIPAANLCGVVTGVERHGCALGWPDRRHARRAWLAFVLARACRHATAAAGYAGRQLLAGLRRLPGYRALATHLLLHGPRTISVTSDADQRTVIVRRGHHVIAHVALRAAAPECDITGWWLTGIHVRMRYHGLGVEVDALSQAETVLADAGIPACWVSLPAYAAADIASFQQHGYQVAEMSCCSAVKHSDYRLLYKRLSIDKPTKPA